ncbi:hypothetical protein GCM10010123_21400 [Pilimelia anulata]|uniref:DUF1416 domain-containing protein n=1 Tax=Pilimelia anulata TaxID=53371 RepID=A0A8J3B9P3_9ACTN|nr:hypothetical protein GCM10010123_21400 [Pilimelia anulata]
MVVSAVSGCAAPLQEAPLPAGVDVTRDTVISGIVRAGGAPVGGAYVRLLDHTGEFAAEVVTSAAGEYRFFAAPGDWTLRVLSRSGNARARLTAVPGINPTDITVAA